MFAGVLGFVVRCFGGLSVSVHDSTVWLWQCDESYDVPHDLSGYGLPLGFLSLAVGLTATGALRVMHAGRPGCKPHSHNQLSCRA